MESHAITRGQNVASVKAAVLSRNLKGAICHY